MNKKFNILCTLVCFFCAIPAVAMDTRSQVTKDFMSALDRALDEEDFKKADKFLKDGADINGKDDYGWNALYTAVVVDELGRVKYLVGKGADKEAVSGKLKETPLYCAAKEGKLDIVKYLVQRGADVTIKNENGKTPLQIAEENGKTAVVNYLKNVVPVTNVDSRPKLLVRNNWGKIAIVSGLGLGLFVTVLRWWYARRTGVSFIPKITWFNRKNSPQIQALAPKSFVPVNRL